MRNIISVLFIACICVSFASCSSGDYTATPGAAGTTITKSSSTGTTSTSSAFSATINGVAFNATTTSVSTSGNLTILQGVIGIGTSAQQSVGLTFSPLNSTGTYTIGSNLTISYVNSSSSIFEQYTTGTVNLTTASGGHYVGTFSASDGSNTLTNGKFDVHQ